MPRTPKSDLLIYLRRKDDDEEMDCNTIIEDDGEETGVAQGSSHDRAWDIAKREAEDLALGAATKTALELDCPEECRHRLLEIEVGPVSDPQCKRINNPTPPPKRLWRCEASAPWSVEVRCVNMVLKKQGATQQKPYATPLLHCGDRVYNKGTVTGSSENADRGKAADKAREDAIFKITSGVHVGSDIVNLRCRTSCPVKKVKLLLSEPTVPHCRPQPNGNHLCTVKIDFTYIVECVEE